MTLTCPRCRSALKAEKHETGIAWRCAGCGGQSLNFSQFRRLVPGARANDIWESAMQEPRAPSRRSLCPECQRDMAAVLIPMPGREVELEVCRNCQRLWLDRQENIAGHLAEGAVPGPLPEARSVSGTAQERMAEELARHVRNRDRIKELAQRLFVALALLYFVVRFLARR
jgi:Zn-finger nucleic acid-binding protein